MLRIGIDLGGTKIEGIVIDEDGRLVESERIATPPDYRGTVGAIAGLVERLRGTARGAPVGIGTPGVWDAKRRCMKNCNSTWLNDEPLLEDLRGVLGAALRMANDADCFALSEALTGAASGYDLVFGVILGTGVGGGIVAGGRLLRGPNGITGEWGHTPLPYLASDPRADSELDPLEARLGDRACYCGRRNCVETFLSGPGLARTHAELGGGDLSAEEIAAGDSPLARATLALYERMLARSLAQVINLLDPGVIVIGGGLSNVASLYSALPTLCARYVFSDRFDTSIRPPRHGDASGVRGAASLWAPDYT